MDKVQLRLREPVLLGSSYAESAVGYSNFAST